MTKLEADKIVAAALRWAREMSIYEVEPSPHYTELDRIEKAERALFRVARKQVTNPIVRSKTGRF